MGRNLSNSVPSNHLDVAEVEAGTFGGVISVKQSWDDSEKSMVTILISEHCPAKI